MEMPGQRRLTRKYLTELQTKGLHSPSPSMFVSDSTSAQPSLQSAPGSLADQAAQMEQFGGFTRKSTEELFIQSFVESSTKVSFSSSPAAENLGLSQVAELDKFSRGDSEELFSSWISAGTQNQNTDTNLAAASPGRPHRTRQEPRRVSGELAAILKQQNNFNNNFTLSSIDLFQRLDGADDVYMQSKSLVDMENSFETNTKSRLSNGSSKQARSAPDLFESKVAQRMWLETQAPVTRSRSSELRRRFAESVAAPQINVTTMSLPYKVPSPAAAINGWTPASQALAPTPTSDPSSSQPPPVNNSLSDYVGMLKGSLNRAKQRLGSQPGYHSGVSEDAKGKKAQLQGMNGDIAISPPGILDSSSIRMKQNNSGSKWPSNALERPVHQNMDYVASRSIDESTYGYQSVPLVTQISDSSGGAPNLGLGNLNERMCTSTQANLVGSSKSLKRGNAELDHILAEPISMSDLEGLEFQGSVKNQEHLVKIPDTLRRMGSINSAAKSEYTTTGLLRSPEPHAGASTEGIDDATKRRRVDRQRKMAEAKGRGATSAAGPPDLQAAMKRLEKEKEALEIEVRSLKLNLSFMNRKDSEQTKHIEELEEQNKELKKINLSLQGCDMQL
ncbi:hypothetical protein M758_12G192600 [Ceratodon purpureus]|uniref:Protein CYCLOPS n=1 Tax=Ceratodon purpureus TaxID=3225 RepID=A0A8T0GAH5_CERPU|nr:hypothetical protein KC19_12G189200 [Ceratodon purpureus]KAG0600001.1 hypothetical protein M758_12G192600 [Ceratodon purpureus]